MLYTIENERFRAVLNDHGAELTQLTAKADGYEIIWSGDPAYWTGHSPVLFPFVGKLKDGGFTYRGKRYEMSKHGFARGTDFSVSEQKSDAITLAFEDWKQYEAGYPFRYRLSASYQLTQQGLRFTYCARNVGDEVMYCSLGAHPAINAVDAKLVFPCKETADAERFGEDGLRKAEKEPFLCDSDVYQVQEHTFDHDAYTLKGLKSEYVDVHSAASQHVVRVTFGGAHYVGVWAKPGAPYVCIEPWLGLDDAHDHDGELTRKEGIHAVQPGEELSLALEIQLF